MEDGVARICQEIGSILESHKKSILESIDGLAAQQERFERRLDATLDSCASQTALAMPWHRSMSGASALSSCTGIDSSPDLSPQNKAPVAESLYFSNDDTMEQMSSSDSKGDQVELNFKSEHPEHDDSEDDNKEQAKNARPSMLMMRPHLKKSGTEAALNMSFIMDDAREGESNKWSKVSTDASDKRRPSIQSTASHLQFLAAQQGISAVLRGLLRGLVNSAYFDVFSGSMILGNAILIGLETDYIAANGRTAAPYWTSTILLNVWYFLEILMRMCGLGIDFWCGKDKRWNWLDLVMLTSSLLDLTTKSLAMHDPAADGTARTVRLFRVARVFRVIRMLRHVREFRKLVFSLATSIQTLFWSMMLMVVMMFCFGVFFTQSAVDHMRLHPAEHFDEEDLNNSFGSLLRSMYSLYLAITAGRGWGELSNLLLDVHPVITVIFICFVSLCIFGVMNVVTSVFVESAMQSSQHYKDLLVQEKMLSDKTTVSHMKEIFKVIDRDDSGSIEYDEMVAFVENPELQLQSYFEALDINATDTRTLFELLDEDMSGEVDIDEFCDGCMRLRGTARSFDLHTLRYEVKKSNKRMAKFMQHVMRKLRCISDDGKNLQSLVAKQTQRVEQSGMAHVARVERSLRRLSLEPLSSAMPSMGRGNTSTLVPDGAPACMPSQTVGPPRPICCPAPPPLDDGDGDSCGGGLAIGLPPDEDEGHGGGSGTL